MTKVSNIHKGKTDTFENSTFFLLGFFSTTSILALPIFGQYISAYSIVLIIVFYILFKERGKIIRYSQLDNSYLLWMLIGVLSSLFGFFYFWDNKDFQQTSVSYLPKIALYTIFFLLLKRSSKNYAFSKYICYGLLFGCVFNICWAIVDALLFYITGISITNTLFKGYIIANELHYEMASLVLGETIRSCGINYDPANIGLFAPVVALYGLKKKSWIIYGLSILSILASLSHTAFLGIILVTIYHFYNTKNKLITIAVFIFITIGVVVLYNILQLDTLVQMVDAFIERTEQKADGSELEGARGEYWFNFFKAVFNQPTSFLIGTGYYTASYAYLSNGLVTHNFRPYDPEQTYFSYYFDLGMIGFIIFTSLLYSIWKKSQNLLSLNKNQYYFIFSGIIGSAVAFLGYHYTLYSVVMLVIISGIIQCNYDSTKIQQSGR